MRIRTLIVALLALAPTVGLAQEAQSPIDWPPKAIPRPHTGKVPDFTGKNDVCLDCHGEILDVKTAREEIPNLHSLHLESDKTAYEGKNADCLTCHEIVAPSETKAKKREGWFAEGDVYHPNWLRDPQGLWNKQIVLGGEGTRYAKGSALRLLEPYLYKPTLNSLVCVECHGPDSKIKTFYGAPQAGN